MSDSRTAAALATELATLKDRIKTAEKECQRVKSLSSKIKKEAGAQWSNDRCIYKKAKADYQNAKRLANCRTKQQKSLIAVECTALKAKKAQLVALHRSQGGANAQKSFAANSLLHASPERDAAAAKSTDSAA